MDNISLKKDNEIEEDNNHKLITFSFYITYVFLLTTGTITFIEAMRTKVNKVRHILNLETCISVVAAYFYGKFVSQIQGDKIDYREINMTRYVDWFITTPLMLFTTVIYMQYIKNKQEGNNEIITIPCFIQENKQLLFQIFLCNFGMLLFGLLHELNYLSMKIAIPLGFVFFGMSFYLIYDNFAKHTEEGTKLFTFLISCWALYGLAATCNDITKNTMYNCLDIVSKNFYGLFIFYQIIQIGHKP